MNSLMSYGSDDNSEDSTERFPEMPGRSSGSKNYRKPTSQHEDNYEEVGMDMSEDSDGSNGPEREQQPKNHASKTERSTTNSSSRRSPPSSGRHPQHRSRSRSPKDNKKVEDERRNSRSEDRSKDDRYNKRRDERGSRDNDRDRSRRVDDKGRDRYRDDRRDRRDDRYGRDRRDRRRSRSRDKRRSKSPRRSPKHSSGSPKTARSGTKDGGGGGGPKVFFNSRKEKADKRMDRLDKLGIEFKPDNYPASAIEEAERNSKISPGEDRFFMPGITGRFREQIEKRKLLWQKAKEEEKPEAPAAPTSTNMLAAASGSKATKVYEATAFADDKTSNKFKRLMGIKETDTASLPVKSTDVLKKQQEMFTSMEAQYEVARTATHTMRGVGLGFGSFQR